MKKSRVLYFFMSQKNIFLWKGYFITLLARISQNGQTRTIRRQFGDELLECVWPFCWIGANTKRLKDFIKRFYKTFDPSRANVPNYFNAFIDWIETLQNELTLFLPMFPFDPPENIIKSKVLWCFQRDEKETLGSKGLRRIAAFWKNRLPNHVALVAIELLDQLMLLTKS